VSGIQENAPAGRWGWNRASIVSYLHHTVAICSLKQLVICLLTHQTSETVLHKHDMNIERSTTQ